MEVDHFYICAYTEVYHFYICTYMEATYTADDLRKNAYTKVLPYIHIYERWLP
jgi:hypothetical protein